MNDTSLQSNLKKIACINDMLKKYIAFLALLNKEVTKIDETARPIVVGGSAVFLYTHGGHITRDIDLVVAGRIYLTFDIGIILI